MKISRFADIETKHIYDDLISYLNEANNINENLGKELLDISKRINFDKIIIDKFISITNSVYCLVESLIRKYSTDKEAIDLCSLCAVAISYNKLGESESGIDMNVLDTSIKTILTELKLKGISIAIVESISVIIDEIPTINNIINSTNYTNINSFIDDTKGLLEICNKLEKVSDKYDLDSLKLYNTISRIISNRNHTEIDDLLDKEKESDASIDRKQIINEDELHN